jgi:hypothetical protein
MSAVETIKAAYAALGRNDPCVLRCDAESPRGFPIKGLRGYRVIRRGGTIAGQRLPVSC